MPIIGKLEALVGEITIHLCKGVTGEVVSANLPDDVPIPMVLEILDKLFDIGIDGQHDRFVLYNISQKFEYSTTDTLAGRSTAGGDLNILVDSTGCAFDPKLQP